MNSIDPVYLLKLLDASEVFSADKKEKIKKVFPQLTVVALAELLGMLEKEFKAKNKMLKTILEAKKIFAHKKIKALYDFAEKKIIKDEEIELALLDKELASLET